MIDKDKVKQAISEMTQNPDWADVLRYAPGAANLRVALAFYASKNLPEMDQKEKDEYHEFREMLERQLNATELKYLAEEFNRMGVEAAATHYNELFSKKTPEEQADAEAEFKDIMEEARQDKEGGGSEEETEETTVTETVEETQDEAPVATPTPAPSPAPAQQPQPAVTPATPASPAPAPQGEGTPAPAAAPADFTDDEVKAFVERGGAMLKKGIRLKGQPKPQQN